MTLDKTALVLDPRNDMSRKELYALIDELQQTVLRLSGAWHPAAGDVDDMATVLWRTEAEDAGAPASIAAGRTREAFDEQAETAKDRWRKFSRAALRSLPPDDGRPTHRHKKRGSKYVLIGIGKMQSEDWFRSTPGSSIEPVDMREVAIYRSVDDGSLGVRPREEFEDGRFEATPPPPEAV